MLEKSGKVNFHNAEPQPQKNSSANEAFYIEQSAVCRCLKSISCNKVKANALVKFPGFWTFILACILLKCLNT